MIKSAISRYMDLLTDTHRGYRVWPKFDVHPSHRAELEKLLNTDGRFIYRYKGSERIGTRDTDPVMDILDIQMRPNATAKTKIKDDDPMKD